jgi:hypothetical protein
MQGPGFNFLHCSTHTHTHTHTHTPLSTRNTQWLNMSLPSLSPWDLSETTIEPADHSSSGCPSNLSLLPGVPQGRRNPYRNQHHGFDFRRQLHVNVWPEGVRVFLGLTGTLGSSPCSANKHIGSLGALMIPPGASVYPPVTCWTGWTIISYLAQIPFLKWNSLPNSL